MDHSKLFCSICEKVIIDSYVSNLDSEICLDCYQKESDKEKWIIKIHNGVFTFL